MLSTSYKVSFVNDLAYSCRQQVAKLGSYKGAKTESNCPVLMSETNPDSKKKKNTFVYFFQMGRKSEISRKQRPPDNFESFPGGHFFSFYSSSSSLSSSLSLIFFVPIIFKKGGG